MAYRNAQDIPGTAVWAFMRGRKGGKSNARQLKQNVQSSCIFGWRKGCEPLIEICAYILADGNVCMYVPNLTGLEEEDRSDIWEMGPFNPWQSLDSRVREESWKGLSRDSIDACPQAFSDRNWWQPFCKLFQPLHTGYLHALKLCAQRKYQFLTALGSLRWGAHIYSH